MAIQYEQPTKVTPYIKTESIRSENLALEFQRMVDCEIETAPSGIRNISVVFAHRHPANNVLEIVVYGGERILAFQYKGSEHLVDDLLYLIGSRANIYNDHFAEKMYNTYFFEIGVDARLDFEYLSDEEKLGWRYLALTHEYEKHPQYENCRLPQDLYLKYKLSQRYGQDGKVLKAWDKLTPASKKAWKKIKENCHDV